MSIRASARARKPQPKEQRARRPANKVGVIYLITCLPTGEQYVGLTSKRDFRMRWREHWRAAKTQTHKITALYTRMRQFEKKDFTFKVLMQAPIAELYEHERRLIEELGTRWGQGGLNLTAGGESSIKRE